ncbi:MAG: ammonia-forming cytochrome c nitrite reductase subunit c552 [Deltaproteobacteria bacterium]|jgi:nitrite reductase (cytochrome c-552)|nr:ammonia-forming cytochrome c nitrite reductase subunit c552 [Deltaproteobacteria bacterium]
MSLPPVSPWLKAAVLFCGVTAGVVILALVTYVAAGKKAGTASLFDRQAAARYNIKPHSAKFGLYFPREHESWARTADMGFESRHMGSRPRDTLGDRPALAVFWAGYAFARDYRAPRGHAYALDDVRATLRTGNPGVGGSPDIQTSTCWTCKSPDVPRMMEAMSPAAFYSTAWSSMGAQMANPVGCADCHDPVTLNPVVTRPALREAFRRAGKDVDLASEQEMRSLVCAQCHVEYYFRGEGKYLVFPWDRGDWGRGPAELGGVSAEQVEEYYDRQGYSDFTNSVSGTPIIKAQHPDWELHLSGTHGRNGVSCADCHMPRRNDMGLRYSDHQIRSPLADVRVSCGSCHRDSEDFLRNAVYERQDKVAEIRGRLEAELFRAHVMARAAMDAGAAEEELVEPRKLIRASQWRWDFVASSHGASFHAPLECARILGLGLDRAYRAQLALQELLNSRGAPPVELPDVSTLEKAQAWIGLDMPALRASKEQFAETVVPRWVREAVEAGRI